MKVQKPETFSFPLRSRKKTAYFRTEACPEIRGLSFMYRAYRTMSLMKAGRSTGCALISKQPRSSSAASAAFS